MKGQIYAHSLTRVSLFTLSSLSSVPSSSLFLSSLSPFSQVRNILAEYMPLEDNASGRVHSPHTMRVAHGGGETDTAAMI